MRMWMVDPAKLCDKHLLGEHVELHMFVGAMKRGTSMRGFLENNLLEPLGMLGRHDALVAEMERRCMNHKSPMTSYEVMHALSMLDDDDRRVKVDAERAHTELMNRCSRCRELGQ